MSKSAASHSSPEHSAARAGAICCGPCLTERPSACCGSHWSAVLSHSSPHRSPEQRSSVLTFDRVSYRYAGYATPVLHDVSLTLQAGEIVGLVGANDAGKSTLCLVASGMAPGSVGGALTSGAVRVDDRPMADS